MLIKNISGKTIDPIIDGDNMICLKPGQTHEFSDEKITTESVAESILRKHKELVEVKKEEKPKPKPVEVKKEEKPKLAKKVGAVKKPKAKKKSK